MPGRLGGAHDAKSDSWSLGPRLASATISAVVRPLPAAAAASTSVPGRGRALAALRAVSGPVQRARSAAGRRHGPKILHFCGLGKTVVVGHSFPVSICLYFIMRRDWKFFAKRHDNYTFLYSCVTLCPKYMIIHGRTLISIKADFLYTPLIMQTEICENVLVETEGTDGNDVQCQTPTFGKEDDVVGFVRGLSVQQPNRTTEAASDGRGSETEGMGMPPPKPEFDRGRRAQLIQAIRPLHQSLARAHSTSPPMHEQRAKEFLRSPGMTLSLPSLDSSRWTHNRAVGNEILSQPSECGRTPATRHRIKEFDLLLKDL
jgi:hypothetical protein